MPRIDADALEVLALATCDGQNLYLPEVELERGLYERVNEVIVRLGGKWKKGKKSAHVFAFYDPAPLLAATLATGEMPPKNPTAFFPTPAPVIDLVFTMASIERLPRDARILEPSAGTGAIVDAIRAKEAALNEAFAPYDWTYSWEVDCCEVLPVNRSVLEAKGHRIVADDCTAHNPGPIYDAVLMNPPFSLDGDPLAYITHVFHAWDLLKPKGVLVAVVPRGWQHRKDRKCEAFLDLVNEFGSWEDVEGGAFKESGTMVATAVVALEKTDNSWKDRPHNGCVNWSVWELGLWADNEFTFYQQLSKIAAGPEEGRREAVRAAYVAFWDDLRRKVGTNARLGEVELDAHYEDFLDAFELRPARPAIDPAELELGGLFALAA